jgi:hypothetical protein
MENTEEIHPFQVLAKKKDKTDAEKLAVMGVIECSSKAGYRTETMETIYEMMLKKFANLSQ